MIPANCPRADVLTKKAYKVSVTIPAEFTDELMDAVNDSMKQIYPGYDRVFSLSATEGTWRALEGSDPYSGEIGKITIREEIRIDFAVAEEDLKNVISAVRRIHPYEEPAIDIIPMLMWKDIINF